MKQQCRNSDVKIQKHVWKYLKEEKNSRDMICSVNQEYKKTRNIKLRREFYDEDELIYSE